jgi:superfamily II RNA helicase
MTTVSPFLTIPNLSIPPKELPQHPYSFPLDPFQQHAICAISKDENVLVSAKTGSGKSVIAEYQIFHSLSKGKRVFYTTPIKSLSNQKFYDLKHQFPNATTGIMTGDIKFCPDAQIVIMTTEILRNLLYKKGTRTEHLGLTAAISMEDIDAVIFDECHYINDPDRGKIWEEIMILLEPSVNMVMLSATLDHPEYLASWLGDIKKKPIHLIETHYRIVPLTHNVLQRNRITDEYELAVVMDAKETYNDSVYQEWLLMRQRQADDVRHYKEKVKDVKAAGTKGAVDGKNKNNTSFTHQLNEVIPFLERQELLPALFFVLSRKQCEQYAAHMEHSLLSSSDTASVKHIISFHLHRYMGELEKVAQYYQIYDLLCRGIAFHHSGILPLLKEIIEILFSKGFVKLLFCTETFAVGLNMPTKTVLFAGFKKYDERVDDMRILRNDEYIQMAGRAGRRGKDDKGIVIYLPDRDPLTAHEMKRMMKGAKPEICSRMEFHAEFIMKTMQASMDWHHILKSSYWYQQYQVELLFLQKEHDTILSALKNKKSGIEEKIWLECEQCAVLERLIKESTNAQQKDARRQLDSLKNRQMGPKWAKAIADYKECHVLERKASLKLESIVELESYELSIESTVQFLYDNEYILTADIHSLSMNDMTIKGILATEINEGHPMLMTELYTREILHELTGIEICAVLACFLESSNTSSVIQHAPPIINKAITELEKIQNRMSKQYTVIKWDISKDFVDVIYRWMNGETLQTLCADYELFEGNLIRTIMKMSNMIDEWISMAEYCQHVEQVEKMANIREKMIRGIVIPDSLYLRL